RKNSVTHRKARRSIRDAIRRGSPRDRINPLRLDAALDIKRELAPQKEILCFDRPARSECESAPAERLGDQLKIESRVRSASVNHATRFATRVEIDRFTNATNNCGATPRPDATAVPSFARQRVMQTPSPL